jgi:dGTPase
LPIVERHWAAIGVRHPGISTDKRQRALVRDMIGSMVGDVLAESARRVSESGVTTLEDVRGVGKQLVGLSAEVAEEERVLKRFLYARLYESPQLEHVREEAERIVANLAAIYRDNRKLLPEAWQRGGSETEQLRTVGDFIAGMTDTFAIARHQELVGPVNLPDRF